MARLLTLCLLLVFALAACGGTQGSAPAAVPTDAPTAVPTAEPAAFSDPTIGEAATQERWADQLAEYAPPDDRDAFRTQVFEVFQGLAELDFASLIENSNSNEPVDIRMSMSFRDITTELVSETDTNAEVMITGGTMTMGLIGEDVEQLGELADQMSQEVSIGDFLESGENEPIKLVKIDGVWYLQDLLGETSGT